MLYCRARFGEGWLGRSMGFGNRLFPWARCRVFAHLHHAQVVSPVWLRPAIGQLYRGGIDYRSYLRQLVLYGLFNPRAGDLGVIEGLLKRQGLPELPEPARLDQTPAVEGQAGGDAHIVFKGYEGFFSQLNGWSDFLHAELRAITRPRYLAMADAPQSVPLALCVRCGNDFDEADDDVKILKPGQKTPIKWFVRCVQLVRETAGACVKVFVVSDGTQQQLAPLLELDNVIFVRPGAAISDLLLLSRAKMLIVSGSSSFAAWGAFLGQMPAISHPGQPLSDWMLQPSRGQFLDVVDPAVPSPALLDSIRQSFGGLRE